MADLDKVIKGLEYHASGCEDVDMCPYWGDKSCLVNLLDDARELLKKQKKVITEEDSGIFPWQHIWDAPDGSFKGACDNCGFVHFFVEGHDAQYKFCPQCGEQKMEL